VGQPDAQKARAQLAGRGAGEEGLAAARRSVEKKAAPQRLAVGLAQLRVAHRLQEGDVEAALDVLHAADVLEPQVRPLDLPPWGGLVRTAGALGDPDGSVVGTRSVPTPTLAQGIEELAVATSANRIPELVRGGGRTLERLQVGRLTREDCGVVLERRLFKIGRASCR